MNRPIRKAISEATAAETLLLAPQLLDLRLPLVDKVELRRDVLQVVAAAHREDGPDEQVPVIVLARTFLFRSVVLARHGALVRAEVHVDGAVDL